MINQTHYEAAQLLAEGELTYDEIGCRLGVSRQAICSWKKRPEFVALVSERLAEYCEEIRLHAGSIRERRIAAQNRRWLRLQRIIEKRAAQPEMAEIVGGDTGLLCRVTTTTTRGETTETVFSDQLDVDILRELREHEKLIAQETGQWAERREIGGVGGGPILADVTVLEKSDLRLSTWQQRAQRRLESRLDPPDSEPEMTNGTNGTSHGEP